MPVSNIDWHFLWSHYPSTIDVIAAKTEKQPEDQSHCR